MLTPDIVFFDIQILVNPPRNNGDFMFMVASDMMNKMLHPHAFLMKYRKYKILSYDNTKYKATKIQSYKNTRIVYVASDMMHKMLHPHASLIKASPRLSAN